MKPLLSLVALLACLPVVAQDQPASEASVRELMALTNSKALIDQLYGQLDGMMESAMNDALGGKTLSAEQEKVAAEMRAKMVAVLREDLGWEDLEPAYIALYTSTFSQAEVDGINTFYRSTAGQAVIGKMPQLMQSLMKMMMERMQVVTPKIKAIGDEYAEKLRAARGQ